MGKYKGLKILACVVLVMGMIFGMLVLIFKADNITVSGNEILSEEEIKANYTSGFLGDNTLVIALKDKLSLTHHLPFVREADISITGKDSVSITVYEKALVACFCYMGEYVYFDKDGMVLEITQEKSKEIPCIEGIGFNGFILNEVIDLKDKSQLQSILDISELINHYKIRINRVVFDEKNEVTLYYGKIKVLLGKKDIYDQQIASVSGVLKKAKKKGLSGTIDMRDYQRGDKIILKQEQKK